MSSRERLSAWFGVGDSWQRDVVPIGRYDVVYGACVGALAVVLFVLQRLANPNLDQTDPWLSVAVAATAAALLVGRRRWPLTTAIAATVHMLIASFIVPFVFASLTLQFVYFICFLSAVAYARDRSAMLMVIIAVLGFAALWVVWTLAVSKSFEDAFREGNEDGSFVAVAGYVGIVNLCFFVGAMLLGQIMWRAEKGRAALAEHAATIERQADEMKAQTLTEERLRLARELHDVVAHHMAVVGLHAGAAERMLSSARPDASKLSEALNTVSTQSRQAVEELRNLLGTLRSSDAAHQPSAMTGPGVSGLADLVAQAQRPGFEVVYELVEDGHTIDQVPDLVAHAIYRVAQESLSNVVTHSTANHVRVSVRLSAPCAEIEVIDNGRPKPGTSGSGLGQVGMRERARALGGQVETSPRVVGGYRVRATFPLTPTDVSVSDVA